MARNSANSIPTSTTNTPKRQPIKAYPCRTCSKSFGTSKARTSHWSSTNHYPVHCSVCNRGFGSDEALAQHAPVHDKPTQRDSRSNVSAIDQASDEHHHPPQAPKYQTPPPTRGFEYKANIYTLLSLHEQEAIYAALLAACHTSERLREEQYTVPFNNKSKRKNPTIQYSEFRRTPASPVPGVPGVGKRRVVAIDCEMVGLFMDQDYVAFLSAVDVLTGEVLLNAYVNPGTRVRNWRTRYSGVTRNDMERAIAQGQALRGWQGARRALWGHIDAETILIGHSLQHDLNVLGIFHPKIVDSGILTAQAVFPDVLSTTILPRRWGLKTLSGYFLTIVIQTGKQGHDCLEDTLATRELVLWCLKYPAKLTEWGEQSRLEYERKLVEMRIAREKRLAEERAKKMAEEMKKQDEERKAMESAEQI